MGENRADVGKRALSLLSRAAGFAAALTVAALLPGAPPTAGTPPGNPPARADEKRGVVPPSRLAGFVPGGTLEREAAFADYTLRTYRDLGAGPAPPASFEVLKDGRRVWAQVGWKFVIGLPRDEWGPEGGGGGPVDPKPVKVTVGQDVTGRGVPDLVVSEWTGGAHCCFLTHVFEIGPELRRLATIDAGHSDGSYFAERRGRGGLVFVTSDWSFAYWRVSFAESPAPRVLLEYTDDGYRLASGLMRAPPQTAEEIQTRAAALRRDGKWCEACQQPEGRCPPSRLWAEMLGLIYGGNAGAAWRLFDLAWPGECEARRTFLREFREQLRTSPYREGLERLNGGGL